MKSIKILFLLYLLSINYSDARFLINFKKKSKFKSINYLNNFNFSYLDFLLLF